MGILPTDEVMRAKRQRAGWARGHGYCPEARILLMDFADAAREMIRLHTRQLHALMENDPEASRFDLLIHDASEKKQNAKYAYMGHLEKHGCGVSDETH